MYFQGHFNFFLQVSGLLSILKRWRICKKLSYLCHFWGWAEWTEFYKRKESGDLSHNWSKSNSLLPTVFVSNSGCCCFYIQRLPLHLLWFSIFMRIIFTLGKLSPNSIHKQVQAHRLSVTLVFCHNSVRIAVTSQMKYLFSLAYFSDNSNTECPRKNTGWS